MKEYYIVIALLLQINFIFSLPYNSLISNGNINQNNPEISLTSDEITLLKKGFKCNNNYLDCSNNGICSVNNDKCLCYEGYITVFSDILDYHKQANRCNYSMKKKTIALIFAILGFGFLHFFLGSNILGCVQLILFIIVTIILVYFIVSYSIVFLKPSPGYSLKFLINTILIVILGLLTFLWWTCDIFYVLSDLYTDSSNIPLYPLKM